MPRLPYTNFHDLNLNWFLKEFKKIIASVSGKQDAPAQAGTAGQVLGLNDGLQPVWVNQEAGTIDYSELDNKPSINGVELSGNKTGTELGVIDTPAAPGTAGQVLGLDASLTPKWINQEGESVDLNITGTASGPIASFDDGANNEPLQDLQIAIEPVQAGTGDPSPDNVRPISGWTGCNVARCGKNLLPKMTGYNGNGLTATVNDDGSITVTGTATGNGGYITNYAYFPTPIPSGTTATIGITTTSPSQIRIFWENGGTSDILANANSTTITTGKVQTAIRLYLFTTENTAYNFTIYPQFELGSSASSYEPYQGTTCPITFPSSAGTVYGGTLNPVTGELVVDWINIIFDGTETYRNYTNVVMCYKQVPVGYAQNAESILCNYTIYPYVSFTVQTVRNTFQFTKTAFNVSDDTELKALLAEWNGAGNPLQICYKLQTPLTYTITPTEIRTLLGQNNIWADTGDVLQCVYKVDPDIYLKNVAKVKILTPAENNLVLKPFPTTYNFGERTTLTLTATADTYYKFMFKCPSDAVTNITINGASDTAGDIPAAGKTYIVEIWAGIANYTELVLAVG